MSQCIQDSNSIVMNGRTASDPEGSNTCYTHNGSSLVDYGLCSRYVVDCIDLKVEDLNPLSDHCSITTYISLKTGIIHKQDISTDIEPTCNTRKHIPYKWKHDFREQYETNIESIVVKTQLQNLYDILNKKRITPYTLNNSVLTLTTIIRNASKECANKPRPTRHNKKTAYAMVRHIMQNTQTQIFTSQTQIKITLKLSHAACCS